MHSAGKLFRATALTFQGRIQKIQKGVAGTLSSSILCLQREGRGKEESPFFHFQSQIEQA